MEPSKPKTWKEKRAEAKAAREAKKAAAAAAKAAAAGEGEVAPTADAVAGDEISSAPLDERKPEAATEAPVANEAETPAVTPAPVATGGAVRSIQIASFSKEENANRAVEALSKIGITALAKKNEKDGKVFWGVVATGDQALLQKIKDAGFADAYFLN